MFAVCVYRRVFYPLERVRSDLRVSGFHADVNGDEGAAKGRLGMTRVTRGAFEDCVALDDRSVLLRFAGWRLLYFLYSLFKVVPFDCP